MKRISFIIMLIFAFSCSGSDDNQPAVEELSTQNINLAGRWDLISKSVNGHYQAISDCESRHNYYLFGSDDAVVVGRTNIYSDNNGSYFCEQGTYPGSYSVEGSIVTIGTSKYNIVSANSLTIKIQLFSTSSGNIPEIERVTQTCNKVQ